MIRRRCSLTRLTAHACSTTPAGRRDAGSSSTPRRGESPNLPGSSSPYPSRGLPWPRTPSFFLLLSILQWESVRGGELSPRLHGRRRREVALPLQKRGATTAAPAGLPSSSDGRVCGTNNFSYVQRIGGPPDRVFLMYETE
jgi:hypothetical protein